jgi:hypothetical protein
MQEAYLFNSNVQVYRPPAKAIEGTLKIDQKGFMEVLSSDKTFELSGSVKEFRFENRGFGVNVGVQVRKKAFSFSKPVYEVLFYDPGTNLDNVTDEQYENFKTKKQEFLAALTSLNAYSGGLKNFTKMLILGILGVFLVALAIVLAGKH